MKYSIITPVYNREDCIARCIESVCRNLKHYTNIEHVIVDDGSSDQTVRIVNKYVEQNQHIKFIKFDNNKGTNAARNAAINHSSGEYCIFLDSDDYFLDNAIEIINSIVSRGRFRHFCFSPDDMVDTYSKNKLLSGKKQYIIKYEDFLLNKITGDFIHVIDKNILKKYPFYEDLRINEGVFFKRFYKEEKEILFINKIVTIRERSRHDSVTRTTLRNNKNSVERTIKANSLFIEWFSEDLLVTPEGKKILSQTLLKIIDGDLILGKYGDAKAHIEELKRINIHKLPLKDKIIFSLHLSNLYYLMGCIYVFLKYKVIKKSIK